MNTKRSYGQILRASVLMGGSSAINMLLGMVRVKFVAIIIGTSGVGLVASFNAVCNLLGTFFGMGISSSAVREVAAANVLEDSDAIGRVVLIMRRISLVTGLAGLLLVVASSRLLSNLTFDSSKYTLEIAALGLVILFGNLSGGQMALLQGMRRIGDMARANVLGGIISTLIAVLFYKILGSKGIVPSMVCVSAAQWLVTWYYARRLQIPISSFGWLKTMRDAGGMLNLGAVFMFSALVGSGVNYFTITLISLKYGLQSVGIYSAAFALSGVFVNFILNSMGSDYYPRLSAAIDDKEACNQLMNEQTEIGLLIAGPGLLATMILAPWAVKLFYSSDFLPAVSVMQIFVLGCLGRVISWPLGFLMLAMGKSKWLFISELGIHLLNAIMLSIGLYIFGLNGVALAFVILYLVHIPLTWMIARKLTGFKFSKGAKRLIIFLTLMNVTQLGLSLTTESNYIFYISLILLMTAVVISILGLKKRNVFHSTLMFSGKL